MHSSLGLCIVLTHRCRAVKTALTSALTFRSWLQTRRFWRRAVKVWRQAVCSPAPLTQGQGNIHRTDHLKAHRGSCQRWSVPPWGEYISYMSTLFLPKDYGAYIALFYSNFNWGFQALFTGHIHHIYSFRATTKCILINVSRAIWGSVSCLRTIWQGHINVMPGHIITRR